MHTVIFPVTTAQSSSIWTVGAPAVHHTSTMLPASGGRSSVSLYMQVSSTVSIRRSSGTCRTVGLHS